MKPRLMGLLFAAILCSATAQAAPIITATVLDNGQVVGPTDTVVVSLRISNVGDESWNFFPGTRIVGLLGLFAQYTPPTFLDMSALDGLAAGSSIDLPIFRFEPSDGSADPGDYVAPFATTFYHLESSGSRAVVGDISDTYRWTVANRIPEPGTLALLIAGVVGIAATRRRST